LLCFCFEIWNLKIDAKLIFRYTNRTKRLKEALSCLLIIQYVCTIIYFMIFYTLYYVMYLYTIHNFVCWKVFMHKLYFQTPEQVITIWYKILAGENFGKFVNQCWFAQIFLSNSSQLNRESAVWKKYLPKYNPPNSCIEYNRQNFAKILHWII